MIAIPLAVVALYASVACVTVDNPKWNAEPKSKDITTLPSQTPAEICKQLNDWGKAHPSVLPPKK